MAEYLGKSEQQKKRAYSPAVITQGGKTVWLAGQTATQDEQGKDISGNFEAQVRTIFSLLDKTLQELRRQPRQHGDDDGVHHRSAARRQIRRDARRLFPERQFSGERADHRVELRAARGC